jgi:cytochrome P450
MRFDGYVRLHHNFVHRATYVPFRSFKEDVRREFMQRLPVDVHGTLFGSYLRDAL